MSKVAFLMFWHSLNQLESRISTVFFSNFIISNSVLRMMLCLNYAKKLNYFNGKISFHSKVFSISLEYSLCLNTCYEKMGGSLKLKAI